MKNKSYRRLRWREKRKRDNTPIRSISPAKTLEAKTNRKVYMRKFYLKNKEDILMKQSNRRKNPEFKKREIERQKEYYKKNKEKILQRYKDYESSPQNKIKRAEQKRLYYLKNKDKVLIRKKARWNVNLKPDCEICSSTILLERHHWRYDKPLLINTLCKECHGVQHRKGFYSSFGRIE